MKLNGRNRTHFNLQFYIYKNQLSKTAFDPTKIDKGGILGKYDRWEIASSD